MDSILVSFLATGSCFSIPPLQIMFGTFSIDSGPAFAISVSTYYLAAYHSAVLSLVRGPRLIALLGCVLQIFGWSLVGANRINAGLALLGIGCRAVKESLIPILNDRSRGLPKQDIRLVFCTMAIFHEMSPAVVYWVDQSRMTFFEPTSMTLQWLAALLALFPFIAGAMVFFRFSNHPIPGEHASIFQNEQSSQKENVDETLIWVMTILQSFVSLRVTNFFSSALQSSMGQFVGDPGGALVFVEIAWMMQSIGGLICYPVFWLLLDKINSSGMLLIACLMSFIWSSLIDRGTFPGSAFGLFFLFTLKPLLNLTFMTICERHSKSCQISNRHYSIYLSASGLFQLTLVIIGHWVGLRNINFILNGGIAASFAVCIMHESMMAKPLVIL